MPHRRRAVATLEEIVSGIEEALAEQGADGADLLSLATLGGELDYFRRVHLPFFTHYGPDERYLTLLAARLADESGFTIPTPILGTFSSAGYWTSPALGVICLPAGDHGQLLAFPDLVHELAHILLAEADAGLTSRFVAESIGPYANNLVAVDGDGEYGDRLYSQYQDWFVEFAADAIATYVCGPSYGWQNVRLRAQSGTADVGLPWEPAAPGGLDDDTERFTHPADSARATVITTVLRETSQPDVAARMQQEWHVLTAAAGKAPVTYAVSYPVSVLDELVAMTLDWCRAKGLTAFADAAEASVVRHIDRAWARQLEHPVAFASEEASRVAELRALVEGADGA